MGTVMCLAPSTAFARQGLAEAPEQETATDDAFDKAVQLESFDLVWETIRKVHWDPEVVGEKWDAARERYRPLVEDADSINEVREAINDMLESLDQSHFGIIPEETYKEIEEDRARGGEGTAGLRIRLVEEQLVVAAVEPDSPAATAGVEPGWAVTRVADKDAEEILEKCKARAEHSVMRAETTVGLVLDARTSGKPGDELLIEFLDNDDQPQSRGLTLVRAPGELEEFGHLPPFTVDYQSDLRDEIGYIRFNAFIGGPRLAAAYKDSLDEFRSRGVRGLIIDLRGNRGGLVILVSGMCGWLVDDRSPIGTMRMAGGTELKLALNPRNPKFEKPVAVLVDECSISAAEIMAAGLRDLNLAEVFGSTTAGLVLPSIVTKLPNGDGFQYAMASYHSANGQSLEGEGVRPTQPVELTRQALAKEADPVLAAAKAWMMTRE